MAERVVSSRLLERKSSAMLKWAKKNGPVLVRRGSQADLVLLNVDDYLRLGGNAHEASSTLKAKEPPEEDT